MVLVRIYKVDSSRSVGLARLHINVIFFYLVIYRMCMQASKFSVAVEELS